MLSNATVFVVPVPMDLLPQLNNLDGNKVGDLNDNSEGNGNNNPDDGYGSNEDDNGDPGNNGEAKGKAEGHDKN